MSHALLAEKQRKSLLRGGLHLTTTEREHSSLIGAYVRRVPRYGFSEIKRSGGRSVDNIPEGRRGRMESSGVRMPRPSTPETCGQRESSEITSPSPVAAFRLDRGPGPCTAERSCLLRHGHGQVVCSSLSQAIDGDASASKTRVSWKRDLPSCQKRTPFCVHRCHTAPVFCFFFFRFLNPDS